MLLALFVARPAIAIGQAPTVVRRIGYLDIQAPEPPEEIREGMSPLRELGWEEGRNLHVERRYANKRYEALQPLADELVQKKVEVIVTTGTPATIAAMRATTTIPIVFSSAGDPVSTGLVESLARPGGNVTGASIVSPELTAKYLSLLKELLPGLQRIAVLEVSGNPYVRATRGKFEETCRSLGLVPLFVEIASPGEISDAITQAARQGPQALVLRSEPFVWDHRFEIVDVALKYHLPIFAEQDDIVRETDALISYYAKFDQVRQIAKYVDRILRGAKPADLPVEQPTQFELVINLKAARALGITVPQSVLLRADVVIR